MTMSRRDAELFYDGPIPPGAVDPSAPDRFREPLPRPVRMVPKPEFVRARMARVIAVVGICGTITEADLLQQGFTKAELREHFQDALREAMLDGTLPSIEAVA